MEGSCTIAALNRSATSYATSWLLSIENCTSLLGLPRSESELDVWKINADVNSDTDCSVVQTERISRKECFRMKCWSTASGAASGSVVAKKSHDVPYSGHLWAFGTLGRVCFCKVTEWIAAIDALCSLAMLAIRALTSSSFLNSMRRKFDPGRTPFGALMT